MKILPLMSLEGACEACVGGSVYIANYWSLCQDLKRIDWVLGRLERMGQIQVNAVKHLEEEKVRYEVWVE